MPFNTLVTEEDEKAIQTAYKHFQKARTATEKATYFDALENAYESIFEFIQSLNTQVERVQEHRKHQSCQLDI